MINRHPFNLRNPTRLGASRSKSLLRNRATACSANVSWAETPGHCPNWASTTDPAATGTAPGTPWVASGAPTTPGTAPGATPTTPGTAPGATPTTPGTPTAGANSAIFWRGHIG